MADIRATTSSGKKTAGAKSITKKSAAPASKKTAASPTSNKTAASPTSSKKETAPSARKTIAKKATTSQAHVDTQSTVTPDERRKMIAEAAFIRAERRGFVGGDPAVDWLEAEAEIDRILSRT